MNPAQPPPAVRYVREVPDRTAHRTAVVVAALALLAGCTEGATPEPTPTPTATTTTPAPRPKESTRPPIGPGFDASAPAIDLLLPSQEPTVLNDVDIMIGVGAEKDAGWMTVETGDGFSFSQLVRAGDTVDVPGLGVVGLVESTQDPAFEVAQLRAEPGLPNPFGIGRVRVQAPAPYLLTARALAEPVLIEQVGEAFHVTVGQDDPVVLDEETPTVLFDDGYVALTPAEDGAAFPWRVELSFVGRRS